MQFNRSLGFFYFIDEQLSVSRDIIRVAYIMEESRIARLLTTSAPFISIANNLDGKFMCNTIIVNMKRSLGFAMTQSKVVDLSYL